MKTLLRIIAAVALLCAVATAQNFTTITGGSVQDASGAKLALGQICFLATDSTDTPINFQAGGGGQVIKTSKCASVIAGVIGTLQVATPAATTPAGISYRVTVKDTSTGVTVILYRLVQPTGASWSFDAYAPSGATIPTPTPASTSGNFTVNGNLSVTGAFSPGTVSATNVYASAAMGIGTVSPVSILHLEKSGTGNYVRFTAGGTLKGLVGISNGGGDLYSGDTAGDTVIRGQGNIALTIASALALKLSSSNITIASGVNGDGGGFKHKQLTFTTGNPFADVSLSWATAFADSAYDVSCAVINGSGDTTGHSIIGFTASGIVVRVFSTGVHASVSLSCTAIHN